MRVVEGGGDAHTLMVSEHRVPGYLQGVSSIRFLKIRLDLVVVQVGDAAPVKVIARVLVPDEVNGGFMGLGVKRATHNDELGVVRRGRLVQLRGDGVHCHFIIAPQSRAWEAQNFHIDADEGPQVELDMTYPPNLLK